MENVTKNGDSWSCKVKNLNKTSLKIEYETYEGFSDEKEAARFYELCDKKFRNDIDKIKKVSKLRFTFTEYLNYFLDEVVSLYAKEKYYKCCEWAVKIIIIPNVEEDVILEFVTGDYINGILKRCSTLCKTAAPEARKFLSLALKHAYTEGYMPKDILPEIQHYELPKPKIVSYSKENLKRLLQEAYEYNHKNMYLEILLALCAGLRSGEIRGLKFDDFSPKERQVCIRRQITGRGPAMETPPKSINSYRTLKVADIIFEELEERREYNKKLYKATKNRKYLIYVSMGEHGKVKSETTYNNALRNITNRRGLPHITMHGLRHMFVTIQVENNKSMPPEMFIKEISRALGHKSIGTTLDIYLGNQEGFSDIRSYIEEKLDPIKEGEVSSCI